MVTRIGGFRRKTRNKLAKSNRAKGKISLSKYFQKLEIGTRVCLKAEPAVHGGMYHPRFHGKSAVITGMKGSCYIMDMKDRNKLKTLVVHPVHLQKM